LLLITHDIGVVAEMADRVMVMYTGKIVEAASTAALLRDPRHPYTQGLLSSAPQLGTGRGELLQGIPGTVPDFLELPQGCTFHPRCIFAGQECMNAFPPIEELASGRECACYKVT
jgi:oligopeptide/dipeptide ABC transporter ATP-binding protein